MDAPARHLRFLPLVLVLAARATLAADVLHHRIEATLQPADAGLRVVDEVVLREPGPGAVSFLLHGDLQLESIVLAGDGALSFETLPRWRPRDFWDRPPFDELESYGGAVHHRVLPPASGWPDPVRLTFGFSGAVYDSLQPPQVAYGRGFETTSGLIDPRGAYLFGQTFWVPWFGPDDLFDFELTTSLPTPWQSMSQGERTAHFERDGRNITTWRESTPMGEIYLIAGPYTIRERTLEGIELYTYTYADTPDDLCATYLDATERYLERYSRQFGAYPFAKFAMVENWWQTGYGMPGFTFLGDRVIRLPFIVHTSYGHEILHNWWGNGVYVKPGEGNWCEGLTTYGADYAYKEEESASAALAYRRDALAAYRDHVLAGGRDFALRDFRERSDFATQAVGYGKTMMVFHMLRQRVGEDGFNAGLRELFAEFSGREAGWSDVAESFVRAAGLSAGWIEQWVDRPGALDLALGRVERGEQVQVELLQVGDRFDVRIPMRWIDADGVHDAVVEPTAESHLVTLPGSTRAVAFDPDFDLFRKLYREEIPASLSQTLGAALTTVLIGEDAAPEVAQALRELGREWAQRAEVELAEEADGVPTGRALFLLGDGPAARRAIDAAAVLDPSVRDVVSRARAQGWSAILCARDPADAEVGWAVVLPADPAVVPALGRKIPHYSRYGYLLFDGDQNVEKGSWNPRVSPLRLDFEVEE